MQTSSLNNPAKSLLNWTRGELLEVNFAGGMGATESIPIMFWPLLVHLLFKYLNEYI